ncbi:MAG: hypothetical protein U5K56_00780 [Halioglobus sp.]|nr:hypothetical protein [Halioglobus sp.]
MFQFPGIAQPGAFRDSRLALLLRRTPADFCQTSVVPLQKTSSKWKYVVLGAPVAGTTIGEYAEAVAEVRPEAAFRNFFFYSPLVAVIERTLDFVMVITSDSLDFSRSCSTRRSLDCTANGQFAYFVEKQRAFVCQLELAGAIFRCAGKGSFYMPEQFCLG